MGNAASLHQPPARIPDTLRHFYLYNERHGSHPLRLYKYFQEVLEGGYDPNEKWDSQYEPARTSPLFSAVLDDDLLMVKLLLRYGARIDDRNSEGRTALHEAIVRNHGDLVQVFIESGANLETQLTSEHLSGGSSLHLAAAEGSLDVVQSLLRHGANPRATSHLGWTALDIAILDRQKAIVDVLLNSTDVTAMISQHLYGLNTSGQERKYLDDQPALASHVVEHGVRGSGIEHRNLYMDCLSKISCGSAYKATENGDLGTILVDEIEAFLMELSGMPGTLAWSRSLCAQCHRFQGQDGHDMFDIFVHSADYSALSDMAKNGCHLCHFLRESLRSRWCLLHQIDRKWINEFGVDLQVRLKIGLTQSPRPDLFGFHQMMVTCGEKIAFIDLNHVQKYLNSAVSKTAPSDTQGTGSERSLAVAAAWLQQCLDEHPSCCLGPKGELPTRVVNVGDESRPPTIYITKREQEPYVALSYCRGSTTSIRSLTSNIDVHMQGIPSNDLPKTMADAVIITRALGLQYLWIDELCILQNSEEDGALEIANMGHIYANALVTIAVRDSTSCLDGCFRGRNWTMSAIFPLDLRLPAGTREKESAIYGRMKIRALRM